MNSLLILIMFILCVNHLFIIILFHKLSLAAADIPLQSEDANDDGAKDGSTDVDKGAGSTADNNGRGLGRAGGRGSRLALVVLAVRVLGRRRRRLGGLGRARLRG